MRAVVLAGGESSRFWPLSEGHKSLIEILGEPLIARTINNLQGVDEVVVVEGPGRGVSARLKECRLNKEVEFRVQDSPRGMWDAILVGADDYGGDVLVLSAHHFSKMALEKIASGGDLKLLLSRVPNPKDYGVAVMDGDRVRGIVEKPKEPPSDLIVNSIYRLPYEFIRKLRSYRKKEHYLFERALSDYLREHPARAEIIPKEELPSLKYPWDALSVMERLLEELAPATLGDVSEKAHIEGEVFVDRGAKVFEGAFVKGPAYIGKGAIVGTGALVRQSSVERGAVVGFGSEVAKSLVGPGSKLHHAYVGDSVLGESVWMGFGCVTANRRLDKKEVSCRIDRRRKGTGRGHFGCAAGRGARFGINSLVMPGILIGRGSVVGPNTVVDRNLPDGKKIYVVQKKVIK